MADLIFNFKTVGDQVVVGALRQIGGGLVDLAGNALSAAADAFSEFAVDSFKGAIDAQKGIDELTASIGRMGANSPVTIDAATQMADQFKNLVGGSDDAVLAMTNVGLRFNQIGSEVFPRFIESSADLAAVLKVDGPKAAEILGKTLQDMSVDGVGALGRLKAAGVQLTDEQEQMILKMVEAGDTAGAQNLLLDALAATTGGAATAAANTAAGQWAIFQESIADAGEGVMLALMPALTELSEEILPVITPLIQDIANAAAQWITGVFVPALLQAVEWVKANWPAIQQAIMDGWAAAQPVFQAIGEFITNVVVPAFQQAVAWVQANWPAIQQSIMDGWAAVQPVLQAVWDFIQTVVIPAFQAAVAWVVANWPTLQATISSVMAQIQAVIQTVLSAVQAFWNKWGGAIMSIVNIAFSQVKTIFAMWSAVFSGDWHKFGELLRTYFDTAWQGIMLIVQNALKWFLEQDWGAIGTQIIQGIANGITAAAHFIVEAATAAAKAAFDAAKGFLGIQSPSKLFAGIGENMMLGMAGGITANAALPAYASAGAAYAATVSVGNIIVDGSRSPVDTGYAVKDAISQMARDGYARARMR